MKLTQASVSHNIRAPIETVSMICKSLINSRVDCQQHLLPQMKLNLELDMLKGIQSASSLVGFLMDELLDN